MSSVELLFPSFLFGKDDPAQALRLVELGVGGFCLYRGRPKEIADLVGRLQARAKTPLLFCADYEDGTATHVRGGTAFPSNMALAASGKPALAYRKAVITAVEARAMGVRWVFAPVLDLGTRPENPIVNTRAFSDEPEVVARFARAYMRGLRSEGVLSCAKHFPGHGDTGKDSHLELPLVPRPLARLRTLDMRPFAATRRFAGSVMLAHLHIPALERRPGFPIMFSEKAVSGLLRRELGYGGLVVTDALNMRAVSQRFSDLEAAERALKAGADVILVPQDPERLALELPSRVQADPELERAVQAALRRLRKAKKACGLGTDRGLPRARDLKRVGCDAHAREAEGMALACLAWVRRPSGWRLPSRVLYLEPEERSAEKWRGKAFVAELKRLGVEVAPYAPGREGAVLAASFVSQRAYSGRIRLEEPIAAEASRALRRGRPSAFVSFGSPYLMDQLKGFEAGLCAFYGAESAQRAAARVLVGRATAGGRLPIPLKSALTEL